MDLHPHDATKPDGIAHDAPKINVVDRAVLNLPPSFFSLNMGTGIASILLYNLPYNAIWLQRIGIVIFVFNVVLFVTLLAANLIRYMRWRGLFERVRLHSVQGLFWGCLPMGMATIVVSPPLDSWRCHG